MTTNPSTENLCCPVYKSALTLQAITDTSKKQTQNTLSYKFSAKVRTRERNNGIDVSQNNLPELREKIKKVDSILLRLLMLNTPLTENQIPLYSNCNNGGLTVIRDIIEEAWVAVVAEWRSILDGRCKVRDTIADMSNCSPILQMQQIRNRNIARALRLQQWIRKWLPINVLNILYDAINQATLNTDDYITGYY